MKVVVTGGAGFLGQRLLRALVARGHLRGADGTDLPVEQIVSVDRSQPTRLFVHDRVGYVVGDIGNPHFMTRVLGTDTDSVFHLAAVVSGAAEADFDLGMHVNLDGTRELLDSCRQQKVLPRFVGASSVAVFGGALPVVVTDATAPRPQSSYGVQKLIGELLVQDYTRRGFVDGRAVRLPTIVVRPGAPNAAASSFASSILREPLAGHPALCPVEADTALWLSSPEAAISNLIHAHELPAAQLAGDTTLSLPGITVTVAGMLDALEAVGGAAARAQVRFEPDTRIRAIVQSWPARFDTARADALGFTRDDGIEGIVRRHVAEATGMAP